MKKITFFITYLFVCFWGFGQTSLTAGDIAITGANADDPDEFSFVLLKDVVSSTTIHFTDNGWRDAPDLDFRPGEGTLTWTATTDLPCGTEIIITDNSPFSTTVGSVTDDVLFDLVGGGGGDQIIAYQGLATSPTFLYAIKFGGRATNAWAATAIDDETSAIPNGLVDGTNAVSRNADNVIYDCSQANGPTFILAAVSTGSNWTGSNAVRQTMPNCGFGCEAAMLTFNFNTGGLSTILGVAPNPVPEPSNYEDPGLEVSSIIRGPGLVPDPEANGYSSTGFVVEDPMISSAANIDAAVAADDYYEFSVTPLECFLFDVNSIQFKLGRNPSGSKELALRSSIDNYTTNLGGIITGPTVNNSSEYFIFSFSHLTNSETVTYRIYSYDIGGPNPGQTRFKSTGAVLPNSIEIHGRAYDRTSTWNGTSWDVAPTLTRKIVINDDYDTSIDGSFSGCSLVVNNNATLNITDDDYIEIENGITVDAGSTINVEPTGSVVQNNDLALVTNNGDIFVDKLTAPMDAWYEYTYWSSPVSGDMISNAIPSYNPNRAFIFNGQNFLDQTQESSNDNATLPGQDDIDDNGDDWEWVNGTSTIMQPGTGYATTTTIFAFDTAPGTANKQFRFTFEGPFNNGVFNIPIYRNDLELSDTNWNLIGNPYPSAIDADLFFTENTYDLTTNPSGTLDGAIYIWSQDTAPSAIVNGNEQLNFSDSDYAIINGGTQTAGGDGVEPTNRQIPSGQAFFVTYSNNATPDVITGNINQGSVVFNNSMRTFGAGDNSLFFKSTKSKKESSIPNKLWINLTSDNGIFNQTAIAYLDSATDANDGPFYDTKRPAAIVTGAIIYSNIDGSDKKFGIQCKAENSLNSDETISLGFKSNMSVATLFKLSIDHLEGDFLTTNTIYLKDNLLNKLHDLSVSEYTFTTEAGEFNDRFEIVFNNAVLSSDDIISNSKSLRIIEEENDNVIFTTSNSLNITSVTIFDLLGRQLYNFKGQNTSETYRLSNLSSTIYIAKVELSNGSIITKKAVKK